MAFINLKLTKELSLMAHGKRTHIPAPILAELVLPYVQAVSLSGVCPRAKDDSFDFCERLYALEDRRV